MENTLTERRFKAQYPKWAKEMQIGRKTHITHDGQKYLVAKLSDERFVIAWTRDLTTKKEG